MGSFFQLTQAITVEFVAFILSRRSHKYDILRLLRFLARDSRSVSMKYVNASSFVKIRFSVENSQVFKEPRCINCRGTCTPTTDNSIRDNCPRFNKFEKCALFIEKLCVNLGLIENLIYVGGLWLRRFFMKSFRFDVPIFCECSFRALWWVRRLIRKLVV